MKQTLAATSLTSLASLSTILVLAAVFVLSGCGDGGTAAAASAAEPEPAAPLHAAFTFTEDDVDRLTRHAQEDAAAAIRRDPARFLELVEPVLDLPQQFTVLVDKSHPLDRDYEPDDLLPLRDLFGRIGYAAADRMISAVIVDDLLAMADAAREDGVELVVQSGYRSWSYQETLYSNYVARHGEEAAQRFSAQAGHSQHQLGTAVDFAPIGFQFTGTDDDRWLQEHAWRFGFSLSYPDGYEEVTGYIYEPWHYRYIGREATRLEREFFGGIQQYMLEYLHANGDTLRAARDGT